MKKIFQIFIHDAKKIFINVVALVVIIGLVCLPCIYCWTNLLSSWSPYSDLGDIKVGIYSEDEGYYVGDLYVNIGDTVIEALKENDSVGWVFYNDSLSEDASEEDIRKKGEMAVDDVYGGDTYAAFVIPKDFSLKLVDFIDDDLEHPSIDYYENQKRNAIVPKITSKVKTTVQNQVNESIISKVSEVIMSTSSYIAGNGQNVTQASMEKLQTLNDDLGSYISILNSFIYITQSAQTIMSSSQDLIPDLDSIVKNGQDTIHSIENILVTGNDTINEASSTLDLTFYAIDMQLTRLKELTSTETTAVSGVSDTIKSDVDIIKNNIILLNSILESCKNVVIGDVDDQLKEQLEEKYAKVQEEMSKVREEIVEIQNLADTVSTDSKDLRSTLLGKLQVCDNDFQNVKRVYNDSLKGALNQTNTALYTSLIKASSLLNSVNVDFGSVSDSLDGYAQTLGDGTATLTESKNMAESLQSQLQETIDYLGQLETNEDYKNMARMLENNPEEFASFVAQPTQVDEIALFEISDEEGNSYASSMSSFYSVLALYLASLFCMVMLHAKIKRSNYPEIEGNVSGVQEFFGRWLTFAVVSVITSTILALGNLLFIEVQCKHPVAYVFSMIAIGLVFNLFAYSCAYGLGLIGESLALLCMIVSVACSSSFPMEMLPEIFGKLNQWNLILFQPGMNMLKETIGGFNEIDYWIFLVRLLIYVVAALVIAFGISRIPFVHKFCELLEKRKNDSHVLL